MLKKIILLIFFSSLFLFANTNSTVKTISRGNINIIQRTENIRILSQDIVKNYMFVYKRKNINSPEMEDLKKELELLNKDFIWLAKILKNTDSKDVVDFLAYTKNEIDELLKSKVSLENVNLILDYSELLLEGAESIFNSHKYNFSKEEKMIVSINKMEYLLDRILKFYMAIELGLESDLNKEQLHLSIEEFNNRLESLRKYSYPENFLNKRNETILLWSESIKHFDNINSYIVSSLISLAFADIKNNLNDFKEYHLLKQ